MTPSSAPDASPDARASPPPPSPPHAAESEQLKPSEKKALLEFRARLEDAIVTNQLFAPPAQQHEKSKTRVASSFPEGSCAPHPQVGPDAKELEDPRSVSLWGVPLLPSRGHDGTDVVLLKFLRAREFVVAEALEMLRRTLRWRREFRADGILGEELGSPALEDAAYIRGRDKAGQPVCYNVYGVFKDKDLHRMTFGNEERRERFLRWSVRFMEEGIGQLAFKPEGAGSLLQIIDLKDSLGHSQKELRSTAKKVISVLQDNYPEFVAKNIFINVSFRYYVYHALFSHIITPRSKTKFIFARPSKVFETLLKFISPEEIPAQYGGLRRESDEDFSAGHGCSELVIKGGSRGTIEIPVDEPGVTLVWDITVVGWEVSYKEEFIPVDEGSYKVLIKKEKKLEDSIRNSYYIGEPGKVVLTIDNRTLKRKKVFHRSRSKVTVPLYNLLH